MLNSVKDFIKQSNQKIERENKKVNELYRQIDEYEAVIDVIAQTGESKMINFYREKINNCYTKIDIAIENIKHNRDVITTMKMVNKIIKRGEKVA